MNSMRLMLTLMVFFCAAPTSAHEFWLQAQPFNPPANSGSELSIHVGEYFEGEQLPFTSAYIVRLRQYACGKEQDLISQVPAGVAVGQFKLQLNCAGTHLIALDSHPSLITLPADKFSAYLHDEGLDDIIKRREAMGDAAKPGRERFRRTIKTLVAINATNKASVSTQTAQRLQIVPAPGALTQAPGATMRFQVLYEGKPLANRLVKAWYKRDGQTLLIRARSGSGGQVAFNFPYAGFWMLSVVHMVAATETAEADWDSFWGNLTFDLPGRSPSNRRQAPN